MGDSSDDPFSWVFTIGYSENLGLDVEKKNFRLGAKNIFILILRVFKS
ncbi:hypothetical protein LEP1GSC192_3588 [Leptospira sp. B5-022]|nr:hypothetical protein LEP1GSC192_3588 [Leptospira sp. B5-022]